MANEKRLIDARFLTSQMYMICEVCQTENIFIDAIIDEIDNAPNVDAVEVVHGWWIEKVDIVASYLAECEETFYECSVCNSANFGESPYCPSCGAKMDGDGNG